MIREEIPIKLPSQGLLYPESHPLHKKQEVNIYAMTTAEEDILTSKPLIKKKTVVNELIKSCMSEKINIDDMYFFDRNLIFMAIRIATYGTDYFVKIQCENDMCENKFPFNFNLGSLQVKYYGTEDIPVCHDENMNFTFTLPKLNIPIKFKFLTVLDEMIISQKSEYNKNSDPNIQNNVTNKLYHQIVDINGNKDKSFIQKFIKEMSAMDSSALRKYIDSITPGPITIFDVTCPNCNEEMEVSMPIGKEFFRF